MLINFLKQLGTVVLSKCNELILHLLGTIFGCGLIHFLCSEDYLLPQDCVIRCDNYSTMPMFIVMMETVTQCDTVQLADVFFVVYGRERSTVAQRINLYQTLDTLGTVIFSKHYSN